jgi:type II secretory pathway pseudopilin PulG
MSNVLIGIIGVILFIGLALAGALFLGPRFQESANTSKASAISSSIAQVAQAVEMYRLQEGSEAAPSTTLAAIVPGYLKTMPSTGGIGTANWYALDDDGDPAGKPRWILLSVVDDGTGRAKSACAAVAKNAGTATSAGLAPVLQKPAGTFGCYQYDGSWGYAKGLIGNWHFFQRI